ncbi:MAG: universal stress protein [Candidatus Dormibacteraeota bacterium]|nr:universal stress protein [Candidatus Dormibacteraeota bacterium]
MRILLGIDGTDTEGLLKELATILPLEDHELILAHIHDTGARGEMELLRGRFPGRPLPADRLERIGTAERARADGILEDSERAAHGLARTVGVHADAGEPGRLLVTIAAERPVDLVVVRARSGTGPVPAGPKSLGHTARFVADHSPCPVLLLRHSGNASPKRD